MPRNKVHPLNRKRVARACNSCKRRKERCDGERPCGNCISQKRDHICQYQASQISLRSRSTRLHLQEESSPHNPNSEAMLHLLDNGIDEYSQSGVNRQDSVACSTSAPVPKFSRMLVGSNGRFIYIGDSASLSFLQTIRQAVSDIVGACDFTTDSLRHQMLETTPTTRFVDQTEPQPIVSAASLYVEQYMVGVSGILDLFDQSWLMDQLPAWVADPSRRQLPNSPVIYLSLAIGILSNSQKNEDEELAEQYFGFGRQLATANLMDEPSILTVQSFLLIGYYMVATCRRNGAFINLGVAVRAAYALGIHRHEANVAFVKHEGISRERAWKSLRVCDLFLSASMGRPPATLEETCNIPWVEPSDEHETSTVKAQVASAIFRICHLFERILTEVYSKSAVSLELAASISQQHRDWAKELPKMLKVDGLSGPVKPDTAATCQKLGSSIVTMAYYYSIILLTRPFLTFLVCTRSKFTDSSQDTADTVTNLETYSDGCVDSAIKGVNIAEKVVFDQTMPKRHPLIVNSVFISALCLGLSVFGNYDRRGWPLIPTMDSAIAILDHLGKYNPASTRYGQICRLLQQAAYKYIRKRDEHLLQSSSRAVQRIFGDVQDTSQLDVGYGPQQRAPPNSQNFAPRRRQSHSLEHSSKAAQALTPNSYDFNSILQEPMISTTGMLATPMDTEVDLHYQDIFNMDHIPTLYSGHSSSDANNFTYDEHIPLFSLRNSLSVETYDISKGNIALPGWMANETRERNLDDD